MFTMRRGMLFSTKQMKIRDGTLQNAIIALLEGRTRKNQVARAPANNNKRRATVHMATSPKTPPKQPLSGNNRQVRGTPDASTASPALSTSKREKRARKTHLRRSFRAFDFALRVLLQPLVVLDLLDRYLVILL